MYRSNCGRATSAEAAVSPNRGVAQRGTVGRDQKSPAVASIASLVTPGAGRGILAFTAAFVADALAFLLATTLTLMVTGPLSLSLTPVGHVAIAYDAYSQAERIDRGEAVP